MTRTISDAQAYFGEVAIHFVNKGAILLPVSKAMRSSLHRQFEGESAFIVAERWRREIGQPDK